MWNRKNKDFPMKLLPSRHCLIKLNNSIDSHTSTMSILSVSNVKTVFTTLRFAQNEREIQFGRKRCCFPRRCIKLEFLNFIVSECRWHESNRKIRLWTRTSEADTFSPLNTDFFGQVLQFQSTPYVKKLGWRNNGGCHISHNSSLVLTTHSFQSHPKWAVMEKGVVRDFVFAIE